MRECVHKGGVKLDTEVVGKFSMGTQNPELSGGSRTCHYGVRNLTPFIE